MSTEIVTVLSTQRVKRVTIVSRPDNKGVKNVVSFYPDDPHKRIVGEIAGNRGNWIIPDSMWTHQDLERLVEDLEAAQDI